VATAKNQKSYRRNDVFPSFGVFVGVGLYIIQTVPVRFQRVYQVAEMPKLFHDGARRDGTQPGIWVSTISAKLVFDIFVLNLFTNVL
jgi:hypothetical protein